MVVAPVAGRDDVADVVIDATERKCGEMDRLDEASGGADLAVQGENCLKQIASNYVEEEDGTVARALRRMGSQIWMREMRGRRRTARATRVEWKDWRWRGRTRTAQRARGIGWTQRRRV